MDSEVGRVLQASSNMDVRGNEMCYLQQGTF